MGKNVIERANEVIRHYHITANELAKKMDISAPNAYNYLSGKVQPPLSFIIRFLDVFDDLSAEWLLRGEGNMMKPTKQSHYLEMAARVNGTYVASEEPQTWQQAFAMLNEKIDKLKA